MIIVILIAFILIPLGVLSSIINVNLVYIVVILGLGFILWFAYPWFTLCELIVKQKERALIHECTHYLSKKKKSKIISSSKITTIQIDISDELYGGTSEREMYEVISIKFLLGGGEEFASVNLKANRKFRTEFNSVEQLVDKLQAFTGLPKNVFMFSSHSFIGVER